MINTDKYIWWVLGAIVGAVFIAGFIAPIIRERLSYDGEVLVHDSTRNSYTNETYNFSFLYPLDYTLEKGEKLSEEGVLSLALVRKTDSKTFDQNVNGSETLPGVSIQVFKNDDNILGRKWMETSAQSKYIAGTSSFVNTHIAGEKAVRYQWGDSPDATSGVVSRGDYLYIFTIASTDKEGRYLEFLEGILRSVKFLK